MSVPEISIQIKNVPGQLVQITAILAEANVSIRGVTASSAGKSGWIRLVVDNCKYAEEALEECGFQVDTGEAVAIQLTDEPGTLDFAMRIIADAGINVDYIYTCSLPGARQQLVVIGVQTPGKTEKLLKAQGIKLADF